MKAVELSYGTVDVREATWGEWPELYECAETLANPYISGDALKAVIERIYETWAKAAPPDLSVVTLEDAWKILEAAAGPRGKALRRLPEVFAEYLVAFFGSEAGHRLIEMRIPGEIGTAGPNTTNQ